MTFDDLMNEAGRKLGVELVTHDGMTRLTIDDMEVSVLEIVALDAVALSGVIGEPPPQGLAPQGLAPLYRAMLEANFNFAGTAGATLSVSPEDGALTLARLVPLACLDADAFLSILEGFVNVLEAWRKIVADYRPDATGEAPPAPSAGAPQISDGFLPV